MIVIENGHQVFVIENTERMALRKKYWYSLSDKILKNHGNIHTSKYSEVLLIFKDSLLFLIAEFEQLLSKEKQFSFYKYIFFLHEQSIRLQLDINEGHIPINITEGCLSYYRRVLKLILEQGVMIELEDNQNLDEKELNRIENLLPEILYLGEFIYEFAELYATESMVNDFYDVQLINGSFDYSPQYHYEMVYNKMMPIIHNFNQKAYYDKTESVDFVSLLNDTFKVDFVKLIDVFQMIQSNYESNSFLMTPEYQYLEGVTKKLFPMSVDVDKMWRGLIFDKSNKLSIFKVVTTPRQVNRYLYRPVIIYNVNNQKYAIFSWNKISESFHMLSHDVNWGKSPSEWERIAKIKQYIERKRDNHEALFINAVKSIIESKKVLYSLNVKSFEQKSKTNVNIIQECGEIDGIVILDKFPQIIVFEAKYNMPAYDACSFRGDYSRFKEKYEIQLKRKVDWVQGNKGVVSEHFSILAKKDIDLQSYNVIGVFLINTSTFYMLNGKSKTIAFGEFSDFLDGHMGYNIRDKSTGKIIVWPYFNGPQ